MKRNYGFPKHYPGLYRHDLLDLLREETGLSVRRTAMKIGKPQETARQVFRGRATQKQAWPFARHYGVDWMILHDLKTPLPELRRVVLDGNSRLVR